MAALHELLSTLHGYMLCYRPPDTCNLGIVALLSSLSHSTDRKSFSQSCPNKSSWGLHEAVHGLGIARRVRHVRPRRLGREDFGPRAHGRSREMTRRGPKIPVVSCSPRAQAQKGSRSLRALGVHIGHKGDLGVYRVRESDRSLVTLVVQGSSGLSLSNAATGRVRHTHPDAGAEQCEDKRAKTCKGLSA